MWLLNFARLRNLRSPALQVQVFASEACSQWREPSTLRGILAEAQTIAGVRPERASHKLVPGLCMICGNDAHVDRFTLGICGPLPQPFQGCLQWHRRTSQSGAKTSNLTDAHAIGGLFSCKLPPGHILSPLISCFLAFFEVDAYAGEIGSIVRSDAPSQCSTERSNLK